MSSLQSLLFLSNLWKLDRVELVKARNVMCLAGYPAKRTCWPLEMRNKFLRSARLAAAGGRESLSPHTGMGPHAHVQSKAWAQSKLIY